MKRMFLVSAALLMSAAAGLLGCSKSSSSDVAATVAALTISGSLSAGSSSFLASDNTAMAVTLSDLEIYAIAFTNPPVIAKADVSSSGAFTVDLPGAKGSSVTAIFRDKTSLSEVGTIVFKDTSKTDMNGAADESSSIVLGDSVSLGNITLEENGKVTVDVSTISTVVAAPASSSASFDMSGVWVATAYSGAPTGYDTTCAAGTPQNECKGLPNGAEIALIRLSGKSFTPTSGQCNTSIFPVSCAEGNGTVGTDDKYELSVWEAAGVNTCGNKTGFTADDARAHGRLHITGTLPVIKGNQVTMGSLATATYNPYYWVKNAATSPWAQMDCHGVSVPNGTAAIQGFACYGPVTHSQGTNGTSGWMVNLGNGGCFADTTLKPVMVNNWSNITSDGGCTNSTTGLPTGFTKGSCHYTNVDPDGSGGPQTTTSFTCAWAGGGFANSSGEPNFSATLSGGTTWVGQPYVKVAQGGSCGSQADGVGTGMTVSQAQCYANHYFNNRSNISTGCGPEPRFNWGATTLAEFYPIDYRAKPKSQFILDIMKYDSTGALATVDTEERESFTLSSGASSSVTCEVARKIVMNIKQTSATTATTEIRFTGRMASTAAACQGVAKQAMENIAYNKTQTDSNNHRRAANNTDLEHMLAPQNMIFTLTKQ